MQAIIHSFISQNSNYNRHRGGRWGRAGQDRTSELGPYTTEEDMGEKDVVDMSLKVKCRWRWNDRAINISSSSSSFIFFLLLCAMLGSIGLALSWFTVSPFTKSHPPRCCFDDNEGSWSIGLFFGSDPFSLKPIELVHCVCHIHLNLRCCYSTNIC